jgi:hypothetical protein
MADEPRPPYAVFETRTLEDRDASIAAGHYVGRDVIYALITPAGSRDRVEQEAESWLNNLEEGVKQDRMPQNWLTHYRQAFQAFKESREMPVSGSPIKDWPGASASQINLLLDMNVRTIEDLAEANEETVARIGMGGRALKEKARTWLETASGTGKVAEELEALRVQNKELLARDTEREAEFKVLKKQLEALSKQTEKA